jgi:predicted amidophosphoribosyltransferase
VGFTLVKSGIMVYNSGYSLGNKGGAVCPSTRNSGSSGALKKSSSAKKKKRGYNHAALMAGNFAERAGLVCDSSTVIRTRDTAPMKGLRPGERRANIRGAFEIRERRREKLRGSSVLLVDDIFTTGATIDEIASLLKQAGAARVDFLAYAGGADMIVS